MSDSGVAVATKIRARTYFDYNRECPCLLIVSSMDYFFSVSLPSPSPLLSSPRIDSI